MNFDFSDDQKFLKSEARKFLEGRCPTSKVRAVLDDPATLATTPGLWSEVAGAGLAGRGDPGGLRRPGPRPPGALRDRRGAGPRAGADPVRLHRLLPRRGAAAGRLRGRRRPSWLPKIAAGEVIGCFATVERPGVLTEAQVQARGRGRQADRDQAAGHRRRHRRRRRGAGPEGGRSASSWSTSAAPGVTRETPGDPRSHPRRRQADLRRRGGRAAGRGRRGPGAGRGAPGARGGAAGVRAGGRRRPGAGDGQGLCAGPLRLRPADRQLPGDQAQAGRHVRQERAGPLQRLLRRLGAGHRRAGAAAGGRRGPRRRLRGLLVRRQGEPADPRRHRLHLADGLPPLLPPRAAARPGRRRRQGLERAAGAASSNAATRPRARRDRSWTSTTPPKKPPTAPRCAPGWRPMPRRRAAARHR